MARYVVFVQEEGSEPSLTVEEAESPMAALYQAPCYFRTFKREWFMAQAATPEELAKKWGDVICVRSLDSLIGNLLST